MKNEWGCEWLKLIAAIEHWVIGSHGQVILFFFFYLLGKSKTFLPQSEQFACLRIGLTHNHRSYRIVILLQSEAAKVGNNVVEQRIQITFVFDDFVAVNVALLHLNISCQLIKNAFNLFLVNGFYRFTHQFARITISNWFVIVVSVDIIAKYTPRLALFTQQRCTCQCNLDGIGVSFKQIGKEASFGIVATVCLVNEEDALHVRVVRFVQLHLCLIFFELLNVHHHYFKFAFAVLRKGIAGNVIHQFRATFGIVHNKSTSCKFISGLFHQVNAVDNEVELCHHITFSEIIGQTAHRVISQCRFSATLRVPYNTTFRSFVQRAAYGIRGKHLLVAHYVFL